MASDASEDHCASCKHLVRWGNDLRCDFLEKKRYCGEDAGHIADRFQINLNYARLEGAYFPARYRIGTVTNCPLKEQKDDNGRT